MRSQMAYGSGLLAPGATPRGGTRRRVHHRSLARVAVLTGKKTIPDDLLVREFPMVSEVGGHA
jgi:hypothetical protein